MLLADHGPRRCAVHPAVYRGAQRRTARFRPGGACARRAKHRVPAFRFQRLRRFGGRVRENAARVPRSRLRSGMGLAQEDLSIRALRVPRCADRRAVGRPTGRAARRGLGRRRVGARDGAGLSPSASATAHGERHGRLRKGAGKPGRARNPLAAGRERRPGRLHGVGRFLRLVAEPRASAGKCARLRLFGRTRRQGRKRLRRPSPGIGSAPPCVIPPSGTRSGMSIYPPLSQKRRGGLSSGWPACRFPSRACRR